MLSPVPHRQSPDPLPHRQSRDPLPHHPQSRLSGPHTGGGYASGDSLPPRRFRLSEAVCLPETAGHGETAVQDGDCTVHLPAVWLLPPLCNIYFHVVLYVVVILL